MTEFTKSPAFPVKDPTGELRITLLYLSQVYTTRSGVKYNRASVIRKLVQEAEQRERRREKLEAAS